MKIKKHLQIFYAPVINSIARFLYGPKRYKQLYKTINKIKPVNLMEIGVWNGDRAIKMIETAMKYQSHKTISYYGFDLFEDLDSSMLKQEWSKMPLSYSTVLDKISSTGAKVKLFQGNTLISLPQVCDTLPKMDFIFIDGGHSNETIANDWLYASKMIHNTSVVIFDDYWDTTEAGSKLTVDGLDRDKYLVDIMPISDRSKNPTKGRMRFAMVRKK